MADKAIVVRPVWSVLTLRDADVQRVGALILSTLDRVGNDQQQFSRIVVFSQRVVVFDLPFLDYDMARRLVTYEHLGERLTQLIAPRIIALRKRVQGCAIVIELA